MLLKVPVFMFEMVVTAAALLLQKLAKTWIWLTKISCSRLPADLLALLAQYNDTRAHQKKIVSIINQRISACLAFSPSSFLLNNHAIYFHCGALIAVDQSWGQSCSDDFKRHVTDVKLSVSPQLLSVCYFSDSTVVVRRLHRLIVGNQTMFKESWKLQDDRDIRAHDGCILNTALLDQSSEKVCSLMNFNEHKPC